MSAPTKDQIYDAAIAALSGYPTVAQYVKAGDPRVLAQIGAQATMLAMIAEHVDVAQFEPFLKARDSTVLADASLKGILPLARSCRVELLVKNSGSAEYALPSGRRLLDAKGRIYEVETAVAIAVDAEVSVTCVQRASRTVTHEVVLPKAFYTIQVPEGVADAQLTALTVKKGTDVFAYQPEWFNVNQGDLAFQVETDERRRVQVQLGSDGVVGYGVQAGDVFELGIMECEGLIADLTPDAEFSLEYIYSAEDGAIKATLVQVLDKGADQLSAESLRLMSRYPSIYDHNAVYLGEFDFLLRRYLSPVDFLSVWNEQIEERVRGPNVDSINKLFVSGSVPSMTVPVFQARVIELVERADDSYKVEFVEPVETPVVVVVRATVSVVHDAAMVQSQIEAAILGAYGVGQSGVSKGLSNPVRYQAVSSLLKVAVPALQDSQSDFTVSVTQPTELLPEMFLHVSSASLTVVVERAQFNNGLWNY